MKTLRVAYIALLCSGCASVPVHYYSLLPAVGNTTPMATTPCCDVEITNLRIPPEVDRPELVVRQSDAELAVLANDVWVAPLRDELKAALLNEIHQTLPPRSGHDSAASKFAVRIEVERFEAQAASYALIQVAWRIKAEDLGVECRSVAKVTVGAGIPALIHGYQQAVARVGAQITARISQIATDGIARCPEL